MIVSGYLLLIRSGKILLSRRFRTGYEDGKYSVPAGHIENNETLTSGTCREIREEIGITLKPPDLKLVHVMHRKQADIRMDFFFTVDEKSLPAGRQGLKPKNIEPHKSDDVAWFPVGRLPGNTIPYIRAAIENYRKNIMYSEFGWD